MNMDPVAVQPNILCEICERTSAQLRIFFDNADTLKEERYPYYNSLSEVQASASQGCHLCNLVLATISISNFNSLESPRFGGFVLQLRACEVIDRDIVLIELVAETGGQGSANPMQGLGDLERPKLMLKPADYHLHAKKFALSSENPSKIAKYSISTSSDTIFALLKSWLRVCTTSHNDCSNGGPSREVPTRLLDLGLVDDLCNPRLHICGPEDAGIVYVALSHCWGTSDVFKLTSQTISELTAGIPIESLPKTFQEAIHICLKLGYRYLWIDSLCIFQDSNDDWLYEAKSMKMVYENCAWSLAALHGTDGDAGCFSRRNPLCYLPCMLPLSTDLVIELVRPNFDDEFRHELARTTPLLTRGWVFQECLLPPRTIYFGARGVYWECNSAFADDYVEKFQSLKMHYSSSNADLRRPKQAFKYITKTPREKPKVTLPNRIMGTIENIQFLGTWFELVECYSGKQLSRASDKLIALTGITDAIQKCLGLTPFFGMWKETLLQNLLWRVSVSNVQPPGQDLQQHLNCAPSFSWASMDVQTERVGSIAVIAELASRVLETESHIHGQDGLLAEVDVGLGYVVISGEVTMTTLYRRDKSVRNSWRCKADIPTFFLFFEVYLDRIIDDNEESMSVSLLSIASLSQGTVYRYYDACGLILVPSGLNKSLYRRIGAFHNRFLDKSDWWDSNKECIVTII